ncbi:MAG: SCO family protein, partial [Aigarchaeota archaeon]|nr:SCO family protein [Candidatus Calditenuaceae archaeon]
IIISLQLLVSPQYKPSIEIPPKPMPDFTLIDKDGREFSLSSVKGKPVFLFFGYANCPDICPLVLYKYAYALRNLGGQADDIAFIFITQDPWRDSPETLKIWVDRFDERIIALTGTLEQLEPVWRAYNAPVFYTDDKGNRIENPEEYAKAGKPYFVTHMGFVLVADRDHVLRFALSSEMPQEEYLQAARYVLSR